MSDGVRAEVDGRFLNPENVDAVEKRAREELATGASFGIPPSLRKIPDVPHGDVGWDGLRRIQLFQPRLIGVEAAHRPIEGGGVAIPEVTSHRPLAFAPDPVDR
jgi:hypothetical protein